MINERYIVKKKLGQGRSKVFLCEDIDFPGRDIALKMLRADADELEAEIFRNEFFTLQKLDHPNIVKAIEFGTIVKKAEEDEEITRGSSFFTLEYVSGTGIPDFPNAADESVLIDMIVQLCSVLYYLHQSNYIYYDLKPENVLVHESGGRPFIKIIDLGFAQYTVDNRESVVRGTTQYIAPEILNSQSHDFRVDLYSLGMMLYVIIYGKFPFDISDEIEIYRAHMESEFQFPEEGKSEKIIAVIKKLLKKDPAERYKSAIQVIQDLGVELTEDIYRDWVPVKNFADRTDFINILNKYLDDKSSSEVFAVKGSEGSGKTALVYEIYSTHDKTVFIDGSRPLTGINFVRNLIRQIIYNGFVFPNLSSEELNQIDSLYSRGIEDLISGLKSVFNKVAAENKFTLILDAFNGYDEKTLEILKNLIPIFQVHNIKIILTENSDLPSATASIFNLRELSLAPFTEANLTEYLEKSLHNSFPKEALKKLMLSYADLMPGSIVGFIRDLILFKIISFSPGGVIIETSKSSEDALKGTHEEIYMLRLGRLTFEELALAKMIAAFEISVEPRILGILTNHTSDEIYALLNGLQQRNIILPAVSNSAPAFTSDGLKKFVYSTTGKLKEFHGNIAYTLSEKIPQFDRIELSRQFEIAGEYGESYKILKSELEDAGKISAYGYQKNILKRAASFPLSEKDVSEIKKELCSVYFKLSEYKESMLLADELLKDADEGSEEYLDISIIRGSCLIGLGELAEGKRLFEELLPGAKNEIKKKKLLLEIATVSLNLNEYDAASATCRTVIDDASTGAEEKGLALELSGLVAIYKDGDVDEALNCFNRAFEVYRDAGLKLKVADMQMNVGNIYGMKGNSPEAKNYWDKSLELSRSIGNLEQEAKLLLNFGVYFFDNLELEQSLDSYSKALSIFLSVGNKKGQGLVQTNLGEIFLLTCEYQKAAEALKSSIEIFNKLQNVEEEVESLFLLGKLYLAVGDFENLNIIVKEYEAKTNGEAAGAKQENNLKFLTNSVKLTSRDWDGLLKPMKGVRDTYMKLEAETDYFISSMQIVNLLINLGRFGEALNELENLKEICCKNRMFEAECTYYKGIISAKDPELGLKLPLDYLQEAYELLSDSHISELTWKVLYALAKMFFERGNYGKAKAYINYSLELINFISGNINDNRMRKIFTEQPERKAALEELRKFESMS